MNVNKILEEFDESDDFGFSFVSEEEYNASLSKAAEVSVEEYRTRLEKLEKLILPFLNKLLKTADKDHIYWPNRGPIIKDQIEKILKLTRD